MKTIVAGNWKMHTDAGSADALINDVAAGTAAGAGDVLVIVAPPFPFLKAAVDRARTVDHGGKAPGILVAAQNCHEEEQGAFTGEVSVPMLKSLGVGACIVGHSERRQYYGETDEVVGRKVVQLLKHGLMPIYCCGERRDEREQGRHRDVVSRQLNTALVGLPAQDLSRVVVAYEPVWAIGTGVNASPEQAQEMHGFIRKELAGLAGKAALDVPILYGGSCKPDNAASLFGCPDINGGLIGGAALSAASFTELVRIAQRSKAVS